ncbi:MAG: hypothetical protein R2824_08670 [Saprospiraceae bacterium]
MARPPPYRALPGKVSPPNDTSDPDVRKFSGHPTDHRSSAQGHRPYVIVDEK